MDRQIVLLRGINLGSRNRVAMPELRRRLQEAGMEDVITYVQSGNVVVSSDLSAEALTRECERVIDDGFGLKIAVVVRTRDELAAVVKRNPLGKVATDPKRYQVSFLTADPDPGVIAKLASLPAESERFAHVGRELYAWHPDGVARSKLWNTLGGAGLGVTVTTRNWTTVTKLLEMADGR